MTATLTTPVHVPEHVTVDRDAPAHVAVICGVCRAVDVLYHTVLHRDPDALRKAVEAHNDCEAT